MHEAPPISRRPICFAALLILCAGIFLLLRLRWMGHLLMWDEAMNLCAVRAFMAGGHDAYSSWFWRYPPLFNLLLTLVRPLTVGFAARAEWIPVILGLGQLVTLAALNRRVYGASVALWSCFALSMMPGAVFFGLWIKQDNLTSLLGLLALLYCARQQWVLCGVALGLAFLSKEMAIFYAASIALVLISERRFRSLAVVAGVAVPISIWWYVFFSNSARNFLSFAVAAPDNSISFWDKPWHYYLQTLPLDLGWLGLALAVVGALTLIRNRGLSLWPLALFVPAFLIITFARGKTPWYMMTLYPALATLQGMAMSAALRRFSSATTRVVAIAGLAAFLALPLAGRSYEEIMNEREPGMWRASSGSHEAAMALNHLVHADQSVLITPMHFYDGAVQQPCPIFVIYLKDMPVLVRPNDLSEAQFVDAVRGYELDWAMVSPPPGRGERELIGPLMRDHGLRPLVLREAVIFNTSSLR